MNETHELRLLLREVILGDGADHMGPVSFPETWVVLGGWTRKRQRAEGQTKYRVGPMSAFVVLSTVSDNTTDQTENVDTSIEE